MGTKVRAKAVGFYGAQRRREGDVFRLKDGDKPSLKWMEVLEAEAAPVKAVRKPRKPSEVETAPVEAQEDAPGADEQTNEDFA